MKIYRELKEIKIVTKYNSYIFDNIQEVEFTGRFIIIRRIDDGDIQEIYFINEEVESYGLRYEGGFNNE